MTKRIDLDKEKLVNLYHGEFFTTTQIAKMMNVSDGCVLGNFKRYGIKTRNGREKHWKKEDVELHEQGKWRCWKCKDIKHSDEFTPIKRHWFGHDYICRDCSTKRRRKWKKYNPWKNRANEINKRAGINFVVGEDLLVIWKRENGKCYYCDVKLSKVSGNGKTHFDHVIPELNEKDNLVLSCHKCNTRKSDMLVEDFERFAKRIKDFRR